MAAGRRDPDSIKDFEANLAIATANVANAQIALGATAAAGAASAPTLGFNAKINASHTESQSTNSQTQQNFQATRIDTAKLTLLGDDFTGKGVQGDIGKLNIDNLSRLTLTHGTTTDRSDSQSRSTSIDGSYSATTGALSAGVGQQQAQAHGQATAAHDSKLIVGELNGHADTTALSGASIIASGGNYTTDTLNIKTSQNTATASNDSRGGYVGAGTDSANLSYNEQYGKVDNTTHNSPSGIIYVNADNTYGSSHSLTANHTINQGGVIAAIHTDDKGNQSNSQLNFTTNTLTTQDLLANEHSSNHGFGVNLDINTGSGKPSDAHPSNAKPTSIGASLNRSGSEKQTIALATIGTGATVTGGITHHNQTASLTDINSNALNTQITTKDISTGGLNTATTIDARVFSQGGREEIKNEQRQLPQNLEAVSKIGAAAAVQTVATVGNALTNNQTLNQAIMGAKAPAKMAKAIQDYPEIGAVLDAYQKGDYHNLSLSQEALQALADATGVSTEVLLTDITKAQGVKGGTNQVLTVLDTDDTFRADSISTLGHELDHVRGGNSETLANLAGLAASLNTDAAMIADREVVKTTSLTTAH